jgi:hypothetical protein
MKKRFVALSVFLVVSQSVLSLAGVNVDVNIGIPVPAPRVIVTQPPPVYVPPPPPPEYASVPEVVYETQPQFIFSPALGFYVSVGVPYDIVYIGPNYYLNSGGYWYVGPTYAGPWAMARRHVLPPGLRRYPFERIRYYRDAEYRVYLRDPAHFRGRLHQPEWRRLEHRREEFRREERREERRREERWEERREEHRDRGERR